jgi:hypothetical protein
MEFKTISGPINLVGIQYDGRQEVIKELQIELELVPESGNRWDPNAINVLFQGKSIGFIPKTLAWTLKTDYLDKGYHLRAKLRSIESGWGILQPVIEILSDAPQEKTEAEKEIARKWGVL